MLRRKYACRVGQSRFYKTFASKEVRWLLSSVETSCRAEVLTLSQRLTPLKRGPWALWEYRAPSYVRQNTSLPFRYLTSTYIVRSSHEVDRFYVGRVSMSRVAGALVTAPW